MPFYLKETDVVPELAGCRSALIVVCRFCPATSISLTRGEPYLDLWRGFPNTRPFEDHVADLRRRLAEQGLETEVFRGNLLNFMTCIWSTKLRRELRDTARRYETAVVLGCDAACDSVRDILAPTDCRVVHGMWSEGVWDATPQVKWPGRVSFDLVSVTPMVRPAD